MPSPWKVSPAPSFSALISSVNCRSTKQIPQAMQQSIERGRVLHHFRAVEGRAKDGGVRVLAAQAAAYAAVDDGGHGLSAREVGVVLEGERRAGREPDAGVFARAGGLVHPVLHPDNALSRSKLLCRQGLELALALELAFAVGDDDLEPLVVAR